MKKRLLSLFCAFALVAGLLPVTALAVGEPATLYVGNQQVISVNDITYWTTDEGGNLTQSADNQSWNVKYDPTSATLTLSGATIKGGSDVVSIPFGSGIYALSSSNQPVALTIELIGKNTITGNYGIYVDAQQGGTVGTNASLLIQNSDDDGSLEVSGSSYGIYVKSGTGDASLTIKNASVDAKTTQIYSSYAGVCVQSGASTTDSPNISLSVNGGSLTASASEGNDGIQFYVGNSSASATTSLTVSENAIVDARNGGISASGISETLPTPTPTGDNRSGIVFDGKNGTVYGDVTLDKSLTINQGETLTVPDGSKLDCNNNLTNKGTILVETGGTVSGNLSGGTAVTTPSITAQPTGQTVTEGTQAAFSVSATAGSETPTYQWQQSTDNGGSWMAINDATSASYTTGTTTTSMSGYQYRCVVKSASGVGVISQAATLTVNQSVSPTSYSISAYVAPAGAGTVTVNGSGTSATVTANSEVALAATANDGYRFTGWMENDRQVSTDATYTFKATGDRTLTAKFEKKVTGVTLNTETLELFTGGSATLTATVEPSDAANQNVTWQSDNANVATVEGGTVTAVGAGETDITVTTEDGGKTATCHVTVTQSAYSISADTTALNFGSVYTGYAQPAAQTVTITNDGNQPLTLNQPASTGSFEVGSLSKSELAAGEKATFTVQPKAGLAVGTYSEDIAVSGSEGATVTITASFTVQRYSSGGGSSSSTPSVSDQTVDKIESAKDGATVEITLKSGQTKLDKEVFEALAGRDVTLEITVPGGVTWTVNGQDIPENAKLSDLDLGVTLDASTIPVSVINTITGTVDTIQLSLKHDGEFGFTMTLTAPLGKTNAGYWANLYYYNKGTKALEFQAADRIAADGTAEFAFSHASDYAIVIDTESHEPVELPFTDVPEDAWYADAAAYVYKHGLMAGTSATTFAPDVTTSRAMIATILWRMAGSPVVDYAMTYTDVAQGQWYSEAVRWATSEGVVTGYGNGLFGTNDPITREQLATMLWRYAQTEGYDVSIGEDTNILSYTDVADLSEYAIPAMQWAVGAGIINGTGDGSTLTPQGQATRAQAAMMLQRFCEEYVIW